MTPARPPAAGGPQGAPWTLLALAGVVLLLITWLGVNTTSGVAVGALAALFLVFLFRHLAFAAAALSTARDDMRSRESFDYGYRPRVTVMVPCRNEELVVEGMVTCLAALDYPERSARSSS